MSLCASSHLYINHCLCPYVHALKLLHGLHPPWRHWSKIFETMELWCMTFVPLRKKAIVHHVTTMLTTSKIVRFLGHWCWWPLVTTDNHWYWWPDTLIITQAPASEGSSVPVVSRWLWPGNQTFLEVVTWWIVPLLYQCFASVSSYHISDLHPYLCSQPSRDLVPLVHLPMEDTEAHHLEAVQVVVHRWNLHTSPHRLHHSLHLLCAGT